MSSRGDFNGVNYCIVVLSRAVKTMRRLCYNAARVPEQKVIKSRAAHFFFCSDAKNIDYAACAVQYHCARAQAKSTPLARIKS